MQMSHHTQGKARWESLPVRLPPSDQLHVLLCSECGVSHARIFCEECEGAVLCPSCDPLVHGPGTHARSCTDLDSQSARSAIYTTIHMCIEHRCTKVCTTNMGHPIDTSDV